MEEVRRINEFLGDNNENIEDGVENVQIENDDQKSNANALVDAEAQHQHQNQQDNQSANGHQDNSQANVHQTPPRFLDQLNRRNLPEFLRNDNRTGRGCSASRNANGNSIEIQNDAHNVQGGYNQINYVQAGRPQGGQQLRQQSVQNVLFVPNQIVQMDGHLVNAALGSGPIPNFGQRNHQIAQQYQQVRQRPLLDQGISSWQNLNISARRNVANPAGLVVHGDVPGIEQARYQGDQQPRQQFPQIVPFGSNNEIVQVDGGLANPSLGSSAIPHFVQGQNAQQHQQVYQGPIAHQGAHQVILPAGNIVMPQGNQQLQICPQAGNLLTRNFGNDNQAPRILAQANLDPGNNQSGTLTDNVPPNRGRFGRRNTPYERTDKIRRRNFDKLSSYLFSMAMKASYVPPNFHQGVSSRQNLNISARKNVANPAGLVVHGDVPGIEQASIQGDQPPRQQFPQIVPFGPNNEIVQVAGGLANPSLGSSAIPHFVQCQNAQQHQQVYQGPIAHQGAHQVILPAGNIVMPQGNQQLQICPQAGNLLTRNFGNNNQAPRILAQANLDPGNNQSGTLTDNVPPNRGRFGRRNTPYERTDEIRRRNFDKLSSYLFSMAMKASYVPPNFHQGVSSRQNLNISARKNVANPAGLVVHGDVPGIEQASIQGDQQPRQQFPQIVPFGPNNEIVQVDGGLANPGLGSGAIPHFVQGQNAQQHQQVHQGPIAHQGNTPYERTDQIRRRNCDILSSYLVNLAKKASYVPPNFHQEDHDENNPPSDST